MRHPALRILRSEHRPVAKTNQNPQGSRRLMSATLRSRAATCAAGGESGSTIDPSMKQDCQRAFFLDSGRTCKRARAHAGQCAHASILSSVLPHAQPLKRSSVRAHMGLPPSHVVTSNISPAPGRISAKVAPANPLGRSHEPAPSTLLVGPAMTNIGMHGAATCSRPIRRPSGQNRNRDDACNADERGRYRSD